MSERDARLWTGEREVYRHAIWARHAFGGGACTLLVIGTNKRVLLLYEAATVCAAGMDRQQAVDLVDCLATATGVERDAGNDDPRDHGGHPPRGGAGER